MTEMKHVLDQLEELRAELTLGHAEIIAALAMVTEPISHRVGESSAADWSQKYTDAILELVAARAEIARLLPYEAFWLSHIAKFVPGNSGGNV